MGFLTGDDSPVIWRGPMLHGAIQQFFREVRWDDLDYLIVDMPPGHGRRRAEPEPDGSGLGAIVVTTPQQVSLADTRRAVRMYQKLNVRTLGLIENMSHFVVPAAAATRATSSEGRRRGAGSRHGVPFLGRIPIYEPIRDRR